MYFGNKIILVDDTKEDLEVLSSALYKSGIPCIPFLYDGFDFPESPLSGVRIAFFDIYLQPGQSSPDYNKLADALQKYISKESTPFVLIFWSKHTEEKEKFFQYIRERKSEYPNIPEPYFVDCIDKSEITEGSLQSKIDRIVSTPTLKVLFDFQDVVQKASSKTIKELIAIIPHGNSYGDNTLFEVNFDKVFSKIAETTLGFENAKKKPEKAVYSALIPILNYYVQNKAELNDWKEILTSLKSAQHKRELIYPDSFDISVINTVFHIDNKQDISNTDRGGTFKLNLTKDNFLVHFNIEFGCWFNSFIPLKVSSKERREIRDKSELIAVEISAACDYSQNKNRLYKYIIGVKTPIIDYEHIDKGRLPDSSYNLGNFILDENFQIWLNLNFVIGVKNTDVIIGKPLFIFKDELVNKIGNRYANHISRLGTIDFI